MIYYYIFCLLFALFLIFDFFPTVCPKALVDLFFILATIVIICFAGFRFNTGYDYYTYKDIYETVQNCSFQQLISNGYFLSYEAGYLLLNYLLKTVGYNYFLFILSVISITPKVLFIYKNTDKKFLALLAYYCTIMIMYDMGVMRQALAISFCLYAYKYIQKKDFKGVLFLSIIGSLFHITALVMVVVYAFSRIDIKPKAYVILLFVSFLISLAHPLLLVNRYLPTINVLQGGVSIASKISYYANYYNDGSSASSMYLSVAKRLILLIIFAYYLNKLKYARASAKQQYDNLLVFFRAFYLSIIISLLFIDIPIVASRGTAFLQVAQVMLFSNCIYTIHISNKKISNLTIKSVFLSTIVIALIANSMVNLINSEAYNPYHAWIFL